MAKKANIKKELLIGLVIGMLANLAGSYLYIYFFSTYRFETTVKIALEEDLLGNIIALGAMLNFLVFFVFLKKGQLYRARGVVLATVVAALGILIAKFY